MIKGIITKYKHPFVYVILTNQTEKILHLPIFHQTTSTLLYFCFKTVFNFQLLNGCKSLV